MSRPPASNPLLVIIFTAELGSPSRHALDLYGR